MQHSVGPTPTKRPAAHTDERPAQLASSSRVVHTPHLAEHTLTATAGEPLLQPLPSFLPPSDCNSQPFSRYRFNSTIAPWLNKFAPRQTAELEHCTDLKTFPALACAMVGEQLRQAPALRLEERPCFRHPAGVLACVGPGCYELFDAARTPISDSLDVQNDDESWGKVSSRTRGCLSPDQNCLVSICQERAFIHARRQDGSWFEQAQCYHGEPLDRAQWSPCSQYLIIQSRQTVSVWSERHADHWEQVISQPCNRFTDLTVFSPDSRTFIVDTGDIHGWWRQEDGSWTAAPSLALTGMVTHIAFSKDSQKLALSLSADIDIKIFSRSPQGGWTPDGVLGPDPQHSHPSELPDRHTSAEAEAGDVKGMAFNIHGQLAVGRELRLLDQEKADRRDSHISLALWDLSSHPWEQQSRIVIASRSCAQHDWMQMGGTTSCGGLSELFFSADGRFLIAEDDCKRVKAWCLVPDLPHP